MALSWSAEGRGGRCSAFTYIRPERNPPLLNNLHQPWSPLSLSLTHTHTHTLLLSKHWTLKSDVSYREEGVTSVKLKSQPNTEDILKQTRRRTRVLSIFCAAFSESKVSVGGT